jgi:SSS family solute:Na+ symporter
VQRTLAANNITIGRRGAIFGAYLKLTPILIFLVPGIIAFALTLQDPATYQVSQADRAFPMLVATLLPTGLKGLVASGLMAALMSSLASVFNSASTIFTIDIYKKLRPAHSELELIRIGRIATGVIVLLGIIWIPIMSKIGGGVMYQYLQNVQSYIAPPVTTVFLLGILWKRVNAQAAITTLLTGLVMLVLRLGSEIYYQAEIAARTPVDSLLYAFATVNFSHMAIFLFLFSVALCIGVTLATTPPDYTRIRGLAFGTLTDADRAATRGDLTWYDILFSLILLALVIGILSYFTG